MVPSVYEIQKGVKWPLEKSGRSLKLKKLKKGVLTFVLDVFFDAELIGAGSESVRHLGRGQMAIRKKWAEAKT